VPTWEAEEVVDHRVSLGVVVMDYGRNSNMHGMYVLLGRHINAHTPHVVRAHLHAFCGPQLQCCARYCWGRMKHHSCGHTRGSGRA
jgi:hypothetical protein